MKKWLVLLALFYVLNFVSSYYACSDHSNFSADVREVTEGKMKVINGIVLGLGDANEVTAIKRLEADILIDAQAIEINDNTSKVIEFMDESKYNISLESSTENDAKVKIDSDSALINEGEAGTVGSFDVFVFSSEGAYPGTARVDVVIGRSLISLSNKDNPGEIVTADGMKFSIELFSASDDDASIRVGRCANGTIDIVEIANPITPAQNNSTVNNSNTTAPVDNNVGNESNVNVSDIAQNNSAGENESAQIEKDKDTQRDTIIYIIIAGVFILAVITLIVLIGRSRKVEVKVPASN